MVVSSRQFIVANNPTPLRREALQINIEDRDSIATFCSSLLFDEKNPQETLRSVINMACNHKFEGLYQHLKGTYAGSPANPTPVGQFFVEIPRFTNPGHLTLRALGTLESNGKLLQAYNAIPEKERLDALVNLLINVRTLFNAIPPKSKLLKSTHSPAGRSASRSRSTHPTAIQKPSSAIPLTKEPALSQEYFTRLARLCMREQQQRLLAAELSEFSEA